jgi:hypothetical protein
MICRVYRRMSSDDLDDVIAIENNVYPHPWTRGNFVDSLNAGYHAWIAAIGRRIIGYSIVMIGAEEAHLLKPEHLQRIGSGAATGANCSPLCANLPRTTVRAGCSLKCGLPMSPDSGCTQTRIHRDRDQTPLLSGRPRT